VKKKEHRLGPEQGSKERIECSDNAKSKGVDRAIGLDNISTIVTRQNILMQSKHEERWELKALKCRMERADRKKYRCKPVMDLDSMP